MNISATAALWFLPVATLICVWVAWSDLKYMKIPNKAVLALVGLFIVVGLIIMPFSDFAWRFVHLIVVLAIGFALNMARLIGAGDAKFAAAMALFVPLSDVSAFMMLFGVILIAAFVTHRLFRRLPFIRNGSSDWVSWTSNKFPLGLALGGSMIVYLALGVSYGAL